MITTDLDPQDHTGFRLNYGAEYGPLFSPFNISYVSLKNEKGHQCEDALALGYASDGSLVMVVGDGVSRTALNTYPHPSPAALASNVACQAILDYLTSNYGDDPIARMYKAFAQGNLAVAELNLALGITQETCDYLEMDFASCCAAATTLGHDGLLTIATIGDCVIEVVDLSGRKKLVSDNSVAKLEAERSKLACSKLKQMEIWRGEWRNHPELPNTYGTLTGEPSALPYVTTTQLLLNSGDLVIAHTDGITVTDFPEFNEFLRTGPSPERLAEEIAWYMERGLIQGPACKDDKTLIAFTRRYTSAIICSTYILSIQYDRKRFSYWASCRRKYCNRCYLYGFSIYRSKCVRFINDWILSTNNCCCNNPNRKISDIKNLFITK